MSTHTKQLRNRAPNLIVSTSSHPTFRSNVTMTPTVLCRRAMHMGVLRGYARPRTSQVEKGASGSYLWLAGFAPCCTGRVSREVFTQHSRSFSALRVTSHTSSTSVDGHRPGLPRFWASGLLCRILWTSSSSGTHCPWVGPVCRQPLFSASSLH